MHSSIDEHKKSRPVHERLIQIENQEGLHQALGGLMVVVLQAIFVPNHLPIQLIDQLVHRRIQVSMRALGKQVRPFDMNIAFGALPFLFLLLFFHRQ